MQMFIIYENFMPLCSTTVVKPFSLPSGPAGYRFSHLYSWSIWPICHWNWQHGCRLCVGRWEAPAQGL